MNEQEKNDYFVEIAGGTRNADRIQQSWRFTFSGFGKSKEQNFIENTKNENPEAIKYFLEEL